MADEIYCDINNSPNNQEDNEPKQEVQPEPNLDNLADLGPDTCDH